MLDLHAGFITLLFPIDKLAAVNPLRASKGDQTIVAIPTGMALKSAGTEMHRSLTWLAQGEALFRLGEMPAATTAFQRALAADPESDGAMLGLALVAIHDRDWEAASRWADGAAELQASRQPLALYLRALANLEMGRLGAAELSALKASRLA